MASSYEIIKNVFTMSDVEISKENISEVRDVWVSGGNVSKEILLFENLENIQHSNPVESIETAILKIFINMDEVILNIGTEYIIKTNDKKILDFLYKNRIRYRILEKSKLRNLFF